MQEFYNECNGTLEQAVQRGGGCSLHENLQCQDGHGSEQADGIENVLIEMHCRGTGLVDFLNSSSSPIHSMILWKNIKTPSAVYFLSK